MAQVYNLVSAGGEGVTAGGAALLIVVRPDEHDGAARVRAPAREARVAVSGREARVRVSQREARVDEKD